ncbi:Hypothetical predicted protein [Mytilus galloprovincialis]|uniref:Uncharacterized protein n=1 Tax=Mytilus galloprovincialis TaxID=29158 RepID=A0A8B6C7W1_MYTGA|nr:Hypothetical predicted protein [Mytilus galloprovincialis]
MFIEQWLEQAGDYKSCFLETLVGDNALIRKLNEALYSPGKRNIQQIIINQACQIGNEEIVLMMMKKYDNDINLEETFLKACCNDDDEVTIVEWLLSQYNLNRLNIKKAFENICEFWNIYKNILKTLLKTSANDDNELTNKLLFAAFKTENTESASFIIHRIDLRTFDFRTAVSIACNNHAYKIIEWLLEQSFFMQISSQIDDKPILRIIKWSNKPQPCDIIAVLKDSFKAGDYGMDLMTDRIKYFKNLALIAFRFIAKSSNEIQQLFVKSCHRTHFKIEGVFLDACKSKEFEVLEMVLNFYDECIYSPLITKAGEDFSGIDIEKVSLFSKLPSVIFQNTPNSIIHKNVNLFPIAVKAGDIEKLKIFIRQVDHNKLKKHDEAFGNSIDLGTLQITELLLDSFPMSAFNITEHLENVIQTGKTEVFELILRKVDIHLLDIDQLLTVAIRNGKGKGLLLDILQRIYSQLNFKIYLEKQIVSALAVMDLEVFEFFLQHVDHENINAKRIVMKALQRNKFDIALLILDTVSVNLLEMEKEVVDELVNAIVCNDRNYLRRFLMSCLNVNFDKILTSAAKDGNVSIINDILCHHYESITIDITGLIYIALQHRQQTVVKSLIEHTKWSLDLKLELVDFVERGKTRICELYLNFINIEDSQILNTRHRMRQAIYSYFRSCFVDDHMEHQYLSRLHLMNLLSLHDLFFFACSFHDNKCIAMILINVSEDVVERLMTDTRFNISKDIFYYACSECKDGQLFNAKRLSFATKYGCLLNDTVSDEEA